jgi:tetratricopeptide (TPR) repeat protein
MGFPFPCRLLSAALMFAVALTSGVSLGHAAPSGATEDLRRQAAAQYEEGVAAYKAGRFEEAVSLFLAADRLAPSAVLSFNVARGYEKLGSNARALAYYRDYLRRDPAAANRAAVQQRVAELEALLKASGEQQLTVLTVPEGASLTIDDRALGPTPWTGELAPGAHRLVLSRPGYRDEMREFELNPDRALEIAIALQPESTPKEAAPPARAEPAPPSPSPSSTSFPEDAPPAPWALKEKDHFGIWPWIALGTGGATLLASAAFELSRADAEEEARVATTQIEYADRLDTMESRQSTARVLGVAGGALVATGGVLLVLEHVLDGRAPVVPRVGNIAGAWVGVLEADF